MTQRMTKFGVYSEQQKKDHGSVWYLTPGGNKIEVTEVVDNPVGNDLMLVLEFKQRGKYRDLEYVGNVTEYVGQGSSGFYPYMMCDTSCTQRASPM